MINENVSTIHLIDAIKDYSYFMEKDYPYKAILKIIGDRYRLTKVQRSVLQRGIAKKQKADSRKLKIANIDDAKRKLILIDAYNILITIKSYIDGKFLFIGNDGFLRDTSEDHGQIKNIDKMKKPCSILMDLLKTVNPEYLVFYLDSPISNSGKLSHHLLSLLKKYMVNGKSEVVRSPDHLLSNSKKGIVCTSDSVIIDKQSKVIDLAYQTLIFHFNPQFFSLVDVLN